MMTNEDRVRFSSSPRPEDTDVENEHKKARDTNLPISERGDAFARICKVVSCSQNIDPVVRKDAVGHAISLSRELGTEESADILTELLFDPSSEIRIIIFANIFTFIGKTGDNSFETIVYNVVEELAGANGQPSPFPNEESKALEIAAEHLMRSYSTQFFSALFAPISVSKGSLKWLATSYPKLKAEILGDGSETGAKADRALMAALKSASAQLTDTIDKAMLAMNAMNTVIKSVQSVLGIYSDLLRVSGDSRIVIVSTALTSNAANQAMGTQQSQPHTPGTGNTQHYARGHDSSISQISPKSSNTRPFALEMEMRSSIPSAPTNHYYGAEVNMSDGIASLPYTSPSRDISPRSSTHYPTTPPSQQQRSSSAPPVPTPSKRTFDGTEMRAGTDTRSKRLRKDSDSPKTPSPAHSSRKRSGGSQGGSEPYRGNSRGRYQGRNFIPNYVPNFRGRGGYRGREIYRSSYTWRGRQPPWGGRGERGEYRGDYRGAEYPPRMNYE